MARNRFGRVVVIGAVSGLRGVVGQWSYSTSKAGLAGLVRASAVEHAHRNVTFNLIAPGYVVDSSGSAPGRAHEKRTLEKIPMKRFGRPEEVAHGVAFLTSDLSAYITGTILRIDGGFGS